MEVRFLLAFAMKALLFLELISFATCVKYPRFDTFESAQAVFQYEVKYCRANASLYYPSVVLVCVPKILEYLTNLEQRKRNLSDSEKIGFLAPTLNEDDLQDYLDPIDCFNALLLFYRGKHAILEKAQPFVHELLDKMPYNRFVAVREVFRLIPLCKSFATIFAHIQNLDRTYFNANHLTHKFSGILLRNDQEADEVRIWKIFSEFIHVIEDKNGGLYALIETCIQEKTRQPDETVVDFDDTMGIVEFAEYNGNQSINMKEFSSKVLTHVLRLSLRVTKPPVFTLDMANLDEAVKVGLNNMLDGTDKSSPATHIKAVRKNLPNISKKILGALGSLGRKFPDFLLENKKDTNHMLVSQELAMDILYKYKGEKERYPLRSEEQVANVALVIRFCIKFEGYC